MSKLKQRKDGGYFIHKPGDANPVNTFQVTDEGAEIALSSGCELEESFPDELFYLLHDLGHLSTKGTDTEETGFETIRNLDWAVKELSLEDRVQVAVQIVETHGVSQWNFSSMTQTISDPSSLKMAIDFKSFNMEIGTPSNVSFGR